MKKIKRIRIDRDLVFNVVGFVNWQGEETDETAPDAIPLLDIPMMSNEEWQQICREDREKHPEKNIMSKGERK